MVYFLCKAYDSDRQNCYFAQSLPVRGAWIEMPLGLLLIALHLSLPVRGAWIEMLSALSRSAGAFRRSPCGERGLKFSGCAVPASGTSRSPCGERGLKCMISLTASIASTCRSPCGERGLKCQLIIQRHQVNQSLPVRGAWIEMQRRTGYAPHGCRRSPCGERGLKSPWVE